MSFSIKYSDCKSKGQNRYMKRTKRPNRIVGLANDLIRPSIRTLSPTKETVDGVLHQTFTYGNTKVIIRSRLFEEDRGVLLCLLEMSKKHNNKPFDFIPLDIAKEKGAKNPYQKTSLDLIRDSVDRLLLRYNQNSLFMYGV